MKKTALFLCVAAFALLSACAAAQPVPGDAADGMPEARNSAPAAGETPAPVEQEAPEALYTGKIVQVEGNNVLLAGDAAQAAGDLVRVTLQGAAVTDGNGNDADVDLLRAGMVVEVGYNGMVMETYPSQIAAAETLRVLSEDEDLVGFYLQVLDDLYQTDEGLNGGISLLAFDLDAAQNLSAGEKAALCHLAGERYGLETMQAGFDELCEAGYIDREALYFETGLLITLEDMPISKGTFTFDIQKWRGGLGAYFFTDCTAEKKDGVWTYRIGAEAIS